MNSIKQISTIRKVMKIYVSSGIGTGTTTLSAFDHALAIAGVNNFNLLRLSSVIPPNSEIVELEGQAPKFEGSVWGDRLYTVYAEMRVDTPGQEAWAGVGWVQFGDDKRGLFVEHEGHYEQDVRSDIEKTLNGLLKNRNNTDNPEIKMCVVGAKCQDQPVCALVVAAYKTEGWKN